MLSLIMSFVNKMELLKEIIFVVLISAVVGQEEPKCYSRFDYDEKLLLTLLRIEDKINKFDQRVSEIQQNANDSDYARIRRLEDFITNTSSKINEHFANFTVNSNEITSEIRSNFENKETNWSGLIQNVITDASNRVVKLEEAAKLVMDKVSSDFAIIQKQIAEKEASRNQQIQECIKASTAIRQHVRSIANAFSAMTPINGPTSGSITFQNVLINTNNNFNSHSGEYTCSVKGLYYFTFHLVKKRSSDRIDLCGCYLAKNGGTVGVKAWIDPGDQTADLGSYGVSNSVFLELNEGDTVMLFRCSGGSNAASNLDSQSSFSGALWVPYA